MSDQQQTLQRVFLSLPRQAVGAVPWILIAALTLGSVLVAQTGSRSGARSEDEKRSVLRVPIEDSIDIRTVRLVKRALEEARDDPTLGQVVLDIDSPGGRVDALEEITALLAILKKGTGVEVSAYVRRQALSAGAYIALACDRVYMSPNATIGAITPVVLGPTGIEQIADDDARSKMVSAFRAEVSKLVNRDRDGDGEGDASDEQLLLAEAMVDPRLKLVEVTYIENGFEKTRLVEERNLASIPSDSITNQRSLPGPLTLTAYQAREYGFAEALFPTIQDLVRDEFNLPTTSMRTLEMSWSENFVAWIESFKLLLFIFGFLALFIEVKMPGAIVPGVVGAALIGTALFSSYLIGLANWVELVFFVVGIGLILTEIFLLPGTVLAGVFGLLSLTLALILSQQTFVWPESETERDIMTGNMLRVIWLVVGLILGSILIFRFLPKIPILKQFQMKAPEPAFATGASGRFATPGVEHAEVWVGRTFRTVSDLRPSGVVETADGDRLDVTSTGGFIKVGALVRVIEVGGNRVLVDEVPEATGPEDAASDMDDPEAGIVDWGLITFLMILALALSIAEVFLVSFGLLGIAAVASAAVGIVLAFTKYGEVAGFSLLGGSLVVIPTIVWFAYKNLSNTYVGRMLFLQGPDPGENTGAANDPDIDPLVGKTGVTVSQLRPSGVARIDGKRVDVISRGELIDPETDVVVRSVDGNRVVVAPASAGVPDPQLEPAPESADSRPDDAPAN